MNVESKYLIKTHFWRPFLQSSHTLDWNNKLIDFFFIDFGFHFIIENLVSKVSPGPDFAENIVFYEDHVEQENVPQRNQRVMGHGESEMKATTKLAFEWELKFQLFGA